MGGSKTKTYKDLQIEMLMDDPEKSYEATMREAYKNVNKGMRAVIREYQQGIVETRSMFNDRYLTNLGYNPGENIRYFVVDPILVLNWLKSNVNTNIDKVVSYKWGVPSLEEIALEYLQDTYSGMVLVDKSFLISGVRWYVSGVTNVSTTRTNATCYKDKNVTAQEYATANGLIVSSIEDMPYTVKGINYWKVTFTTGAIVDVPVEYTTIECPGAGSDTVQEILAEYNGREYHVRSNEYITNDMGVQVPVWSNIVKLSAYIDNDGDVKITGTAPKPVYNGTFSSSMYLEATKEAIADIVEQVEKEIELSLNEELDMLVATYELNGVQKLKLAKINKSIVVTRANASAYPIIPLREKYKFVKETRQMKAILNKLGMAADDFETSLDNDKIKNAAILFIINLKDGSTAGTKVVYETLVNMVRNVVPASGRSTQMENYQLDLGFHDVNMKTRVSFGLSTKAGVVAKVGKYVRYSHGIRKQVSESYYEELQFGDGNTSWKVGGYKLSKGAYIPITNLGLDLLTYEELHYAIARSMNMMVLSIVEVKTKWYQSGFFKFVLTVIIIVAAIYTGGWAAFLAAGMGILGIWGVDFGKVGMAVQIVLAVYTMGASLASTTATTGAKALAVASSLVQLASIASQINLQGTMKAIESKQIAKQAELEASEEQLKEIAENTQRGLWMGVEDRSPELLYALSSTAMMCNYDILYDYDGLIDGKIASVGI